MSVEIRRAGAQDVAGVHELLSQVLEVHAAGRPDLFRTGTRKYTDDELLGIFANGEGPEVLGHAFCVLEDHTAENNWQDVKTLYIDDICVSEKSRGRHVGTALYRHVIDYARGLGCHDVTLNVWSCNPGAKAFYQAMGMTPYKIGMEQVL